MDTSTLTSPNPALVAEASAAAPLPNKQRIEALDVVRGFALIGICLMNVDFFNRSVNGIGGGIPAGLTGLNWFAAWFNDYFIVGKFWTIFSLLFGMGFAVMLQQAEKAGRPFLKTYLRRIVALAIFGALHHVVLWTGDILFSYAVAALSLMLVLFGTWQVFAAVLAALIGLSLVPATKELGGFAPMVAIAGLMALYLRHELKPSASAWRRIPLFSRIFGCLAVVVMLAMLASWFVPQMKEARIPLCIFSFMLPLAAFLSAKYYQPENLRSGRAGAGMYVFFMSVGLLFNVSNYFTEPRGATVAAASPAVSSAPAASSPASSTPAASTPGGSANVASGSAASASGAAAGKPVQPGAASAKPVDKQAERKAKQAERMKQRKEEAAKEERIMKSGTYLEALKWRAGHFVEHAQGEGGFALILTGMFLLGAWFVRSGVMANSAAHLPLFRKLAYIGLPLGIGMGLAGSLIATGSIPGVNNGWGITAMLRSLGNLPACLGYVSLLVLMLHSSGPFARVRVLAPFGRMALTNYLTQSVIASVVFYGYGLGHYGMDRAWQFVYVALVIAVQVPLSHWWLANFRYGPMEWLWRAITYWQLPAMRLEAPVSAGRASVQL